MKEVHQLTMEADVSQLEPLVERRRYPRLQVATAVQFRDILKPQERFAGTLSKDLSASGIRLRTAAFFPKEARLVLLLSLPTDLRPIRTIAEVVWVQRHRFAEAYDCGIRFLEILPEDRNRVAEVVERGILQ